MHNDIHICTQVHVLHKGSGQWYEMQDLHVKDILPQMITLTEAYIQVGNLLMLYMKPL